VLATHRVLVTLGDAEQGVEFEAIAATPAEIRLDKLGRIDVVLWPELAWLTVVRAQYTLTQGLLSNTRQRNDLPRLVLVPLGAQAATSRIAATVFCGTGIGANARTERPRIAASTVALPQAAASVA
jgi:hypothetical protein